MTDHTHLCAVDGCARPAPDSTICRTCFDELQSALRTVCEPHVNERGSDMPLLADELRTTTARLDRIHAGGIGVIVRGAEKPLPWREHAAEAAYVLTSTLAAWVHEIAGYRGLTADVEPTAESYARFLLRWLGAVASYEYGAKAVDELTYAIRQAWRAVDRPADRWYAGPCGYDGCEEEIYARPETMKVHCPGCGLVWDVADRRTFLLRSAQDYLLTAAEMSRALPNLLGRPLTSAMIRGYAHRGTLARHGYNKEGDPLYRVRDVQDIVVPDTPQPVCA